MGRRRLLGGGGPTGEKDPLKLRDFIREAKAAFVVLEADQGPIENIDGEADQPPYDWQEES